MGINSRKWSKARRLHAQLINKFSLSLRVPISEYVHSDGPATAILPYLKPTDFLQTMLSVELSWLLLGGRTASDVETGRVLESFWACYKKEHPEHAVFQHPERLSKTFPMTMHGDGGRTQKKQPLEIFSLQPVLGLDTASHRMGMCRCETSAAYGGGDWCDPASQHLNSKHSTYLTHFLVFAFPSKAYLEFPNILTGLLKEVMDNFASACEKGIVTQSGDTWYPACVGFKLDMEWMVKVGSLTRSYQNVGHVNQKPCCHECDAGKQLIPFEDVTDCACWIRTRWATVPWQTMPPWASIPFDSGKPAKILRRDAFHVFRLGICRNFIGSTVHLLIYMGCALSSLVGILQTKTCTPVPKKVGNEALGPVSSKTLTWKGRHFLLKFCIVKPPLNLCPS